MRLLVVPVLNYPSRITADSIWNITTDWCRMMCESDPDLAIYRVVPDMTQTIPTQRFRGDYTPAHERVHDVPIMMMARYDLEETNLPFEVYGKWHPILGDFPIDAVVSTSAIKTTLLKRMMFAGGGVSYPIGMFNMELLIRGLGSNEVSQVTEDEMILQAAGEAIAFNLFESPKCKRIALQAARKFASGAVVNRIIERSAMVFTGYDAKACWPLPKADRYERFTCMVRGRLTNSKNVDEILTTYNKAFAGGRDIKILVTTGDVRSVDGEIEEQLVSNSQIEWQNCPSRDVALEVMRKAHAFIFWSSHELFAVSVWEMLGSGLIGIFKRADWLEGLLPKDWPYVFDTDEEAFVMLDDVYRNYDARVGELAWMVEFCRTNYSYEVTTRASLDAIKRNVPTRKPRDWVVGLCREFGTTSMTLPEVFSMLGERSEMGKAVLKGGNPSRLFRAIGAAEVTDAMRLAGYREVMTAMMPEFVKLDQPIDSTVESTNMEVSDVG